MIDNVLVAGFTLTGILGLAAAIVSVVVEITKEAPPFCRIPTQLWCIIVSLFVCVVAYFGYSAYMGFSYRWYYAVCAVLVAFIVAYIAMYGWDVFNNLLERFVK